MFADLQDQINKQLPKELLELDSQTYELWQTAIGKPDIYGFRSSMNSYMLRESYISNVGFPIMTTETLTELASFCKSLKVLDIGCGTGFITHNLNKMGIDTTAVDNQSGQYSFGQWEKPDYILREDALTLVNPKYDVLIMSWPDLGSELSYKVLRKMQVGQYLIYQGEGFYGCTGCDSFHKYLDSEKFFYLEEVSAKLNKFHIQWTGIHDQWYVYQRVSEKMMKDDEIRRIVEADFPDHPPFILKPDEFQLRLNAVHHFKDYSFINHARQQCMLSEAFAAKRRGESTDYLYELAKLPLGSLK